MIERIIYYIDAEKNYYIDMDNNYFIAGYLKGHRPYIYIDGAFRKVVPYIKTDNNLINEVDKNIIKMKTYCFT